MTETDVKNQIMLELSKRNCKVFNRPTGNFYIKTAEGNYKPVKINVKGRQTFKDTFLMDSASTLKLKNQTTKPTKPICKSN